MTKSRTATSKKWPDAVPKGPQRLPPRRLERVTEYIEAHLAEDMSLLALAAEAGLSPAHFARGFKSATGLPVHRYLMERRLAAAAELLRATDHSIADIALTAGFCSQSHLTSAFKRAYGTTPAAYRQRPHR